MLKNKALILVCLFNFISYSQELKCNVTVNYDKITSVNTQIFKTLQQQLSNFLNNTKFTNKDISNQQKIECSYFLMINSFSNNDFEATLQVTASRPIFNSKYTSPLLNLNDNEVSFKYLENENFTYDQNSFTSNLLSLVTFYANIIIGTDADSFSNKGGTEYFLNAMNIANLAQSSGYPGWVQTGKKQNRFNLISDILSNTFDAYRETFYYYHLKGLDEMANDTKKGKEKIIEAINVLYNVHKTRPNSLVARTFFDAKSDEIVSIFTGGPSIDVSKLVDQLGNLSPLNNSKWSKIK